MYKQNLTIKLDLSLVHTFTLNLLPHNWRLLVNSAGQSFQTGTIILETNTIVSLQAYSNTTDMYIILIISEDQSLFTFSVAFNSILSTDHFIERDRL